jgi:hypothetical protein
VDLDLLKDLGLLIILEGECDSLVLEIVVGVFEALNLLKLELFLVVSQLVAG